jgi:UDP-N-acetyl-2-amino-2-deoxyglucuronate dehydrogenase
MKAILETGNNLSAVLDRFDSIGIIDSYFPDADFFLEAERFDRHLDKLRRQARGGIEFVSICSPNYLHDAHIRLALRNDAHAICEKPLVLNPWNIDALGEISSETGRNISVILQLRHHPAIINLKKKIAAEKDKKHDIDLVYITSRGKWYHWSWKGDVEKSGGLATNIGIHFFDMLTWIFGDVQSNVVNISDTQNAAGYLELEKARIRWFMSIDSHKLPADVLAKGQRTFRSITVEGEEIEFSGGFTDLHTVSYQEILAGRGYGPEDARVSIEIAHAIRHAQPVGLVGEYHPMLKKLF